MKSNLLMDFTVNKENSTVIVKREFAASISSVWAAWTERELLDQWWAPKPWKARTKSMDFKVGGQRLYAMVGPEGEEHWALADYKSIRPTTNFKFLDAFCDNEGNINKDFARSVGLSCPKADRLKSVNKIIVILFIIKGLLWLPSKLNIQSYYHVLKKGH